MSISHRKFLDNHLEDSDTGSGSGTQIGSPTGEHGFPEADYSHPHKKSSTLLEKLHGFLLIVSFGMSAFLLYLTVVTASQNQSMLSSLKPYAIDVVNATNTTWGYGGMPITVGKDDKVPDAHHHGDSSPPPTTTETAFDPEDTTFMLKDTWVPPQGNNPFTSFPTTTDTLDELRPDEVVSYDTNFLVKNHVSTVMQYNRRIMASLDYRLSHPICTVQAFIAPLNQLQGSVNKTLITSNTPIDVHLLSYPPDGPWWTGTQFNSPSNAKLSLRSNMTYSSKPSRVKKLGTIRPWMGLNQNTMTFDCPMPDESLGKKAERIAIEYSCAPGTEESCYFSFDARMTYPMLILEVVF